MDLPDNTTEITRDSSPICTIVKDEIDIEECASNEEQINGCCICGDVHCTNSSNGDNSSQWVQSILLFATLLQKHFPAQGGIKFDNLATCSRCEGMINGVWSLCQQIDLIKIEIQDVLEKAAQLMTDVTMRDPDGQAEINTSHSNDEDNIVPSQFEEVEVPNFFEGYGGREEYIIPDNGPHLERVDGLEVETEKEEEEIEVQEIISVSSGSEDDSSSKVSEDASSSDQSTRRSLNSLNNGKRKKKTSYKKSPPQKSSRYESKKRSKSTTLFASTPSYSTTRHTNARTYSEFVCERCRKDFHSERQLDQHSAKIHSLHY
ncbi:hypothetical protein Fcan01_01058 [Folsomia candida]|uniref:C2H2-type domain-containing protein n=1 Tax=Folsomia candida TaxID=158441 RepID=A0A226F630_FOLCA|nr:hypothetical protein Fcan01_01058 [Folsomia candida]